MAGQAGTLLFVFGLAAAAQTGGRPGEIAGRVEDQVLSAADFEVLRSEGGRTAMKHRRLPLLVEIDVQSRGNTGVQTRRVKLTNQGQSPLRVFEAPTLSWRLPAGEYELIYLHGGWGQERQVAIERLVAGGRVFTNRTGRSTNGYSPWFCLFNRTLGVRYAAQLAWSGNWEMRFEREAVSGERRPEEGALRVALGMRFDFGGALVLDAGQSFDLAEAAYTTTSGSLDEAANALHRYQRQFVVPAQPANRPLLVQFNSWYPFPGHMTVAEMKRCAELAAKIGAEVFVLDSGWYNQKDWSAELGDYRTDRKAFPNSLLELGDAVRGLGMKFGLWVEIENAGELSTLLKERPEWMLQYNGAPVANGKRRQLDFSKAEVRAWATATIDRLMRETGGLDWIKIDYNIDVGERFLPAEGGVLARHVRSYWGWLDEMRSKYPKLIIENCSSGGLRFDLGIIARTDTTWLSDEVLPKPSVQLAYGCTLEFLPEVCNHWMVGESHDGKVDLSGKPGWWDFLFRVPMNGQFGISSRVFDWNESLRERAAANVALYKSIRGTIQDADVYHLTPPPAHVDPEGWMALEYAQPDMRSAVIMAYRLGRSLPEQAVRPRGLDPRLLYRVSGLAQSKSGAELMGQGLTVRLDEPWRAEVIRIHAEQ